MLGRLKCMLFGHKRGRQINGSSDVAIELYRQGKKGFLCPRCGRIRVYKVKVPG